MKRRPSDITQDEVTTAIIKFKQGGGMVCKLSPEKTVADCGLFKVWYVSGFLNNGRRVGGKGINHSSFLEHKRLINIIG